jgi:hypothetical protein
VITTTHRVIAVSKFPKSATGMSTFTHALIAAMTGNALVPNPNPSIPTLTTLVTTVDTTETATKTRTKGTVAARNAALAALLDVALHATTANIQQLADANPEQAQALITSVGMAVRKAPVRTKAPFAAAPGPVSGSVHLAVRAAGKRASYEWEWSSNGGSTWVTAAPTLQAKTTITGLPVATTCQFRFRSVTKAGASDWSQVITIVVK